MMTKDGPGTDHSQHLELSGVNSLCELSTLEKNFVFVFEGKRQTVSRSILFKYPYFLILIDERQL